MCHAWIDKNAATAMLGAYSEPEPHSVPDAVPLASVVRRIEVSRGTVTNALHAWNVGAAMDLGNLGVLGDAISQSRTLGEALRTFMTGFPTIQSFTYVVLEVDGDETHLSYRILDPHIWPRRADAELSLGVVRGICQMFGIPADAIRGLEFEHEADRDQSAFARRLGCVPRFGREDNRLLLATRALDLRRPATASPDTYNRSLRSIQARLAEQWRNTPLSARVLEVILGQIGHTPIIQQDIAARIGKSERSLRRALAIEGVAFHDILEEARRLTGRALMERSRLRLSEIALLLGYSDQSTFSRAFTRWYGVSPREMRKVEASRAVNPPTPGSAS